MSTILLRDIRRFCETRKMAPTTFGRQAVNDPRLIGEPTRVTSITAKRAGRIQAFMQKAAQ